MASKRSGRNQSVPHQMNKAFTRFNGMRKILSFVQRGAPTVVVNDSALYVLQQTYQDL